MRFLNFSCLLVLGCILLSRSLFAQQVIDSLFVGNVDNPAYSLNQGPLILVDAFHNNGKTLNNGFSPIADILIKDGYKLSSLNREFVTTQIDSTSILVIIDALHEINIDNWKLPTPSAFTDLEINKINNWVKNGGNLLLVADHMPFPGASKKLAEEFGIEWINGFVIDSLRWDLSEFIKDDNTLLEHAITQGRFNDESIDAVFSYYGSGFKINNPNITGLFKFINKDIVSYQTEEAWKMFPHTPLLPTSNLYQAAALEHGKGRVVIVAESSLFSAQLVGKNRKPIGINYIEKGQNLQFVLNLFHWLSRIIE